MEPWHHKFAEMTDTIKMIFTYLIAMIVICGGLLFLYQTRADQTGKDVTVVVAGFVGSALTWVFGAETSTRSARQTERALRATPPGE